ncbi:polysaccharide deacetylase [Clostridium fermenticellae]|uniref:Polysaccharide deacetylase n=1 Tax=Clostridium fermenticellae TaxID=2068654 RepID=A0A386H5S4_9CLOT|nr:polysaccharide deacetylase family protein [Clostridium fermenticellae]AYD41097.1 polysaccharide deacetylase [Clostridium fermenticellae]
MKKIIYSFTYTAFILLLLSAFIMPKEKRNLPTAGEVDNKQQNIQKSNEMPICSKKVYLTFDDGPSVNNTRKILKILNDNNVKATFFVVGIKSEENPDILKDISNSGMSIGIHTYSHDYKKIYKQVDSYLKDYENCKISINKITGKDPIDCVRLPGGSTNTIVSKDNLRYITRSLNKLGIDYIDWNVCSGDADSHVVAVEKIKKNIITQCRDKNLAVILMHDTYYKYFTVEALPDVIKYLKNQGFEFRTLGDLTKEEKDEMIKEGIMNRNL